MSDFSKTKEAVDQLKRSSHFTAGDAGSFSVPILPGKLELPGKHSPANYLNAVNISRPHRAAIIFPGNGGLCVEALNRGATEVVALEPRAQNLKAIKDIAAITLDATGRTFKIETSLGALTGGFDTIVWSEGIEIVGTPVALLTTFYEALSPGGRLLVEVTHGEQKLPDRPINSWKPQEKVFVEALTKACPGAPLKSMRGRLDRRVIYEIAKPAPKEEPVVLPQEVLEIPVEEPVDAIRPEKPKKVSLKKKRGNQ